MTKEEVIKKAYGIHWDAVKGYVNENGFWEGSQNLDEQHKINEAIYVKLSADKKFQSFGNWGVYKIRPKSLQGIENNNGWIKIESAKDLPCDYSIEYKGVSPNGEIFSFNLTADMVKTKYYNMTLTHYKQIPKDNPPLY